MGWGGCGGNGEVRLTGGSGLPSKPEAPDKGNSLTRRRGREEREGEKGAREGEVSEAVTLDRHKCWSSNQMGEISFGRTGNGFTWKPTRPWKHWVQCGHC